VAVSWDGEATLTRGSNYRAQVVRTGPSHAVAIWVASGASREVIMRRTADGGETWTTPVSLASNTGLYPSLSASGARVDVAYVGFTTCPGGGDASRAFYRRSLDGGATWQPPRALSSACSRVEDLDVARHPSGQVTVVWTHTYSGRILARTSTDGGLTFGPTRFVAQTDNGDRDSVPGSRYIYTGDPQLAIGWGVTYLAYSADNDILAVSRSSDGGMTWSEGRRLSRSASTGRYSIVATGHAAIIGYTNRASGRAQAVYRRTTDSGATWSSTRVLTTGASGTFSKSPQFAYHAGTLAAIVKAGMPGASPIWHRQSTDFGMTWSARTRVSRVHFDPTDPGAQGIAILDERQLALYDEYHGSGEEGLWARRTTSSTE
jgi:hypothetical protein